jgi:alpha-tubulin suppressor-like RCC1 family protein
MFFDGLTVPFRSDAFRSGGAEAGQLYMCGKGEDGCLGDGSRAGEATLPRRVSGMDAVAVESVDLGDGHCVAITDNGDMWSWGKGSRGQLGHGQLQDSSVPLLHSSGEFWASVSCGGDHCFAMGCKRLITSPSFC